MTSTSEPRLIEASKRRNFYFNSLAILLALMAGCATPTIIPLDFKTHSLSATKTGNRLLSAAQSMLGTPYVYGGTGPKGVDCSGLVHYAHQLVGLHIPRTSQEQRKRARPVALTQLRPGDLVFFHLSQRSKSHVGIYVGRGHFIHAPSSGKQVSYASLNNNYWRDRLVSAGRFY